MAVRRYPFRSYEAPARAERLIAGGRVALAASSLFAVWLDPTEPAKYAEIAYALLAAYLVYAVVAALLAWRTPAPAPRRGLVTHLVDLAFFGTFVYFTAGPASPFNAYFVFSLVCASLRWHWRGTLWTVAAAALVLLGVGVASHPPGAPVEVRPFIIRGVYLAVMAALLGYLGEHQRFTRKQVSLLAGWPDEPLVGGTQTIEEVARQLLEHALRVLPARRGVLAWVDPEEPWLYFACRDEDGFSLRREPPSRFAPLVAPPLGGNDFLALGVDGEAPAAILADAAGHGERWAGQPLHPELAAELGERDVLALRLPAATIEGRLFFAGPAAGSVDELLLGESLAALVAARLDRLYVGRNIVETAAMDERIRLARDLHDGVLQSLAGIGLRLAAVRRLLDEDPAATRHGLDELQRLIALEQRDLRFYIQEIRPPVVSARGEVQSTGARIAELARRVEVEWGLEVTLDNGLVRDADGDEDGDGDDDGDHAAVVLSDGLARDVYFIARESLVNAVRHGEASHVALALGRDGDRLRITADDDGRGFAFVGRYDAAELARRGLGPKTLRERVAARGGDLVIESSRAGVRLEVSLPLPGGPS